MFLLSSHFIVSTAMTEKSQQATGKENVATLASIAVLIVYLFPFCCVSVMLRPLASPCKVAKQSSVLPRQQKPIARFQPCDPILLCNSCQPCW